MACSELWGSCSEEVGERPVYTWFLARESCSQVCTFVWELPGSPVIKTLCFHCRGSDVWSLIRKSRSCIPGGMTKIIITIKYIIPLIKYINSREELPHTRGQERRLRGVTPYQSRGGCVGAGGPRGATPCWRSGGAAMRRCPSSKVRNSGCASLEQLWRDTPHTR